MTSQSSALVVSAGCLLFFDDKAADRQVLDSSLYLQLAASKKYDRFTDYGNWKKTWLEAALYLGWNYQSSLNGVQPAPRTQPDSFWEWAKALHPAFVSTVLLERAEHALLHCPARQAAFDVFAQQVTDPASRVVAMQAGLIGSDDSLTLLQLYFECSKVPNSSTVLGPWAGLKVKGNIQFSFHRLLLSGDAFYTRRRLESFSKLKDHRAGLIVPVRRLEGEA